MNLTPPEQAWLEHDEQLWRQAHEIAARHPGIDATGIHHVLRNLERTPGERLARGLNHGRLRTRPR